MVMTRSRDICRIVRHHSSTSGLLVLASHVMSSIVLVLLLLGSISSSSSFALHRPRHNASSSPSQSAVLEVVPDNVAASVLAKPKVIVRRRTTRDHVTFDDVTKRRHRRRRRRAASSVNASSMFLGLAAESEELNRLSRLVDQDAVAAVLEFNEVVLTESDKMKSCSLKLRDNSTVGSPRLAQVFKNQVRKVSTNIIIIVIHRGGNQGKQSRHFPSFLNNPTN